MIPLIVFLLACAAVYLGTIDAAFSALMRLSLRLLAERSARPGALGEYLDDPVLLFAPVRLLLAVVVAMAFGGVQALILGGLALRVRGLYFALITLSYGTLASDSLFSIASLTGGGQGQPAPLPSFADTPYRYYYFCLVVLAAVIWVDYRMLKTKGGRALPVQAAYLEKLRYRIPLAKNYVNKMISDPWIRINLLPFARRTVVSIRHAGALCFPASTRTATRKRCTRHWRNFAKYTGDRSSRSFAARDIRLRTPKT